MLNSVNDTKQIFEKVGKLFRKYGIKSITMDDISRELGISKKTLYQIVSDKAELVEQVMMNNFNEFKASVSQITSKKYDPVMQLIKLNIQVLEHLKTFSPAVEYDLRKYYQPTFEKIKNNHIGLLKEFIFRNIETGKNAGIYRTNLDTEILTKLHVARIEQAPHTDLFTLEEYTSPGFAREVCIAHLKSLVSEKGQELVEKYMNEIIENNK